MASLANKSSTRQATATPIPVMSFRKKVLSILYQGEMLILAQQITAKQKINSKHNCKKPPPADTGFSCELVVRPLVPRKKSDQDFLKPKAWAISAYMRFVTKIGDNGLQIQMCFSFRLSLVRHTLQGELRKQRRAMDTGYVEPFIRRIWREADIAMSNKSIQGQKRVEQVKLIKP